MKPSDLKCITCSHPFKGAMNARTQREESTGDLAAKGPVLAVCHNCGAIQHLNNEGNLVELTETVLDGCHPTQLEVAYHMGSTYHLQYILRKLEETLRSPFRN